MTAKHTTRAQEILAASAKRANITRDTTLAQNAPVSPKMAQIGDYTHFGVLFTEASAFSEEEAKIVMKALLKKHPKIVLESVEAGYLEMVNKMDSLKKLKEEMDNET